MSLIFEKAKECKDIENLKDEVRRVIRSSLGTRAKEELIIKFINENNLLKIKNREDILSEFYKFAKKEKEIEINNLIEK